MSTPLAFASRSTARGGSSVAVRGTYDRRTFPATEDLSMGGFKLTDLGAPTESGDAGQPGEVVRQYESQIAALKAEQAKTEVALDAARSGGTREQRTMLRELSRTLDQKIRETEYQRDTAKAEANYQKWLAGGKKGLEPTRTGIKRLW